jgi:hypothetical protein
MAAVVGAGIGSAAIGAFVLLNEAGLFAAPALYGPAGGVTGRTTFATIVWLLVSGVLHARWKSREVASGAVFTCAHAYWPLEDSHVVRKEDVVPHRGFVVAVTIGLLVMALPKSPEAISAPSQAEPASQKAVIAIPQSLETEHHEALAEATRAPGRVGAAAKELAAVLDTHFERENQIALPPLGLLAPLAAGKTPTGCRKRSP